MSFYRPPALHEALEAIGSIYRALRAWKFYPTGHPNRKTTIIKAYSAMREMLGDNDLCLTCGRTGFSMPDGEVMKDSSGLCNSLSYELFIRRAKSITFLRDLRQEDLLDLVRLLTIPHDELRASGGLDTLLEQHGVSTIWTNEFDLAVIRGKRQQLAAKGVLPPSLDDVEKAGGGGTAASVTSVVFAPEATVLPEHELQALIGQLVDTRDDDRYLILVRQAVACADVLVSRQQGELAIPLLELLAEQVDDTTHTYAIRQSAGSALEQLASAPRLVSCVLEQMERPDGISGRAATALLRAAGVHAIDAIVEAVGIVQSLSLRKNLNAVLVQMGDAAVPQLLSRMHDQRWYIVRNLCAILGAIGNPDALPELLKCLGHPDTRVCKEAIRSLAKIGGSTAEAALIALLKQGNSQLSSQVMASLAGMKSRRALVEFLTIVFSKDLFLTSVAHKCEALAAVALVGDPVVAPKLVQLLDTRFFLAGKRALQLKIAVAECLGKLSDRSVIPHLQKYAHNGDELGKACAAAIESLESRYSHIKEMPGRKTDGRT